MNLSHVPFFTDSFISYNFCWVSVCKILTSIPSIQWPSWYTWWASKLPVPPKCKCGRRYNNETGRPRCIFASTKMVDYTQTQSNPRYTAYVLQKRWLWLPSNQTRGRKRQDYNGLFVQCKSLSKIILKCYLGGSNYMLSVIQIWKITVQYLTFMWHSNLRYDGIVCRTITNILEEHTASVKITIHQTTCCHIPGPLVFSSIQWVQW